MLIDVAYQASNDEQIEAQAALAELGMRAQFGIC